MRKKRKFQHIALKVILRVILPAYLTLIGLGIIGVVIQLVKDSSSFDFGLY